jgi:CubicO group peptidase (beta-lactamase class C family)
MRAHTRALFGAAVIASQLRAQVGSSLPRSTPEQQGIASSAILDFVRAADTSIDAMNSVMIVRHGHVVAEGWWAPYDSATPHVLYSLSKSFTSTAVGLAVAEGKLNVDDQVLSFFPDDAPAQPPANLRAMRVRDLLRMSTGQQTEPSLFVPADSTLRDASWVRRFFAHPVDFKPGTHFLYNSPATYMLSAIVQKTTGQTVLDYLRPRLFEPLGIEHQTWVASPEGVSAGAFGLNVRTEDIAKLGLLYLQRGVWNGQQLLPAAWVDEATARQTSNGSAPTSDWDQGYGYQFWRSRHGYRGDGAFGQYMLVLPQYDAVVAITSGVRDMQAVMNLVWDKLLPAMGPSPLAEDPRARGALQTKLSALEVQRPRGTATAALARTISRRWYTLSENDRGVRAMALDFSLPTPALVVRTASGETRTPIGVGRWVRSRTGYANGMERMLAVPNTPEVALSGSWTADSVFTLKIVTPQTPFYTRLEFRFTGHSSEQLNLTGEQNVAFGSRMLPSIEGHSTPR